MSVLTAKNITISNEKKYSLFQKCMNICKKYHGNNNHVSQTTKKSHFKKCHNCNNKKCICQANCPLCNKHKDFLTCSVSTHEKICKNVSKFQCKKCLNYFPRRSFLRHLKLKDCSNTKQYECIYCCEIFLQFKQLNNHIMSHHFNEDIERSITTILFEKCRKYTGELPWNFDGISQDQKIEILKIYAVWGKTHIFSKPLYDSKNLVSILNLVICPNISLSSQIIDYLQKYLSKFKCSIKVLFHPEFILESKQTGKMHFSLLILILL